MKPKRRDVKLGSRWVARLKGKFVVVRVVAIVKEHGQTKFSLFNETTNSQLTRLRGVAFLRERAGHVASPDPSSACKEPAPSLPHACVDIRDDTILNRKFFASMRRTVELYEKIQKAQLLEPKEESE